MLSEQEIREALRTMRALLEGVDAGELEAPGGMRDQLRGAVVALEALAGEQDGST